MQRLHLALLTVPAQPKAPHLVQPLAKRESHLLLLKVHAMAHCYCCYYFAAAAAILMASGSQGVSFRPMPEAREALYTAVGRAWLLRRSIWAARRGERRWRSAHPRCSAPQQRALGANRPRRGRSRSRRHSANARRSRRQCRGTRQALSFRRTTTHCAEHRA